MSKTVYLVMVDDGECLSPVRAFSKRKVAIRFAKDPRVIVEDGWGYQTPPQQRYVQPVKLEE